ncbi:MAG: NADH-quinone oxidoreductase subunit N [candidate division Zixibacteria bacterium]|nr:NADH-quinone oxidoreductase subunit N [candidate division Zixibacteria bacterium]
MDFQLPEYNLQLMLPEIVLFVWALVVLSFDLATKRKSGSAVGYLAMAGVLITGIVLAFTGHGQGFGQMFVADSMAVFFKMIFLCAAFMAIGSSFGITKDKIVNHRGEFLGLMLFSTVGMMFLASSNELLSLYVGLELTTIPLFALAAFFKDDKLSVEAGIKYLVVGAFSSALLLYGISFLYGLSGSTDLLLMRLNLAASALMDYPKVAMVFVLATITILAGLGFKLALPPFHQWAPDVYQGAPTPVTAFLSVASKAAGLVAFAKIMVIGLFAYYDPFVAPIDWGMLVGIMAGSAMIVGNVLAVRQTNMKRMLAYSSIAHAGYIMVGMLAMNELGLASVGFYMFAYMFANMGIFAVVALIEERTGSAEIPDYGGFSKSSPFLAVSMTIMLLSLTGIPPLAGFFGKFYVFAAAIRQAGSDPVHQWMYWLVGVGLLTSVVALYYYANVIRTMYFGAQTDVPRIEFTAPALTVILIGVIGTVVFGLMPNVVVEFASQIPISDMIILP